MVESRPQPVQWAVEPVNKANGAEIVSRIFLGVRILLMTKESVRLGFRRIEKG